MLLWAALVWDRFEHARGVLFFSAEGDYARMLEVSLRRTLGTKWDRARPHLIPKGWCYY